MGDQAGVAEPCEPDLRAQFEAEELDLIFFGETHGVPEEGSTQAASRGGAPPRGPDERRRRIWEHVCGLLDQGIDAARAKIKPTRIMDFPFCDVGGLDLAKENGLLERAWVFEVEGVRQNTRLILHGHMFVEWPKRGEPMSRIAPTV